MKPQALAFPKESIESYIPLGRDVSHTCFYVCMYYSICIYVPKVVYTTFCYNAFNCVVLHSSCK